MKRINLLTHVFINSLLITILGCSSSEIKPVDIYPEDMCAHCRMAISDKAFASEIITEKRDVFKFDDLGCLFDYRKKTSSLKVAAIFVIDYESKIWIPLDKSTIVETSVKTPMGSGKVAFKDSSNASLFAKKYPPITTPKEKMNCCAEESD